MFRVVFLFFILQVEQNNTASQETVQSSGWSSKTKSRWFVSNRQKDNYDIKEIRMQFVISVWVICLLQAHPLTRFVPLCFFFFYKTAILCLPAPIAGGSLNST